MNTVTKSELAKKVSQKTGFSAAFCEEIILKILEKITTVIYEENQVHIKNFGSFSRYKKNARPGRDISRNSTVVIPEKTLMKFSASRTLRRRVNSVNS